MFLVTILPGIDQYLRPGIEKLGDTISLFTETDRKTQRAIRNMLLENPDMAQKFSDLEFKAPGTLKKMGFGQMAQTVEELGPSLGVQREVEIGRREIDIEKQELALREFKNNAVLAELNRDPTISAVQMDALISEALGIPRNAQLEGEVLDLIPKEMQAQRALLIMQAAEKGEDVEGSIYDFTRMFRDGKADNETIGAIMSHPILGPQFEKIDEMLQQRENADLQRELADIRLSGQQGRIPASLQNQIFELQTSKPIVQQYEQLLDQWFSLSRVQRIAAVTGLGSKENQELAGSIQSLKQQLAGKLRLAVIGPGAVSNQERAALLNSIGNATSIGALIRDPQYTMGQFEALKSSMEAVEKVLQGQVGSFDTSSGGGTTIQFPAYLMDQLIMQNLSAEQIRSIVDAYLSGGGT